MGERGRQRDHLRPCAGERRGTEVVPVPRAVDLELVAEAPVQVGRQVSTADVAGLEAVDEVGAASFAHGDRIHLHVWHGITLLWGTRRSCDASLWGSPGGPRRVGLPCARSAAGS